MDVIDQIHRLQMERQHALSELQRLESAVQAAKLKNENARSAAEQRRIDTEHRRALGERYKVQDRITYINAQLKLLNSQRRGTQATAKRKGGAK